MNQGKILGNNTPQAYPADTCRDAQTGGLLFGTPWRNIGTDTPAMPLDDAHSGGFFSSGVCV